MSVIDGQYEYDDNKEANDESYAAENEDEAYQ